MKTFVFTPETLAAPDSAVGYMFRVHFTFYAYRGTPYEQESEREETFSSNSTTMASAKRNIEEKIEKWLNEDVVLKRGTNVRAEIELI